MHPDSSKDLGAI